MKIYEYAKKRNIKSREVVKKLHELGFSHVKNHLSLIPEKNLDELDKIAFAPINQKRIIKKDKKTIAYISMECSPFATNGLGDMVSNKIKQSALAGNKNIVIMPKYKINKDNLIFIKEININVNHNNKHGIVYQYNYEDTDFYFIESDYYNRDKLFGFYDDPERFAFLAKAAIELIGNFNISFDIINVHNWPLGLFPILFKENLKKIYPETKIEFSAYGSTYQGIYGLEVLTDVFELDKSYYDDQTVEYAASVNFLKSGLITADKLDINKVALNDLKNSYLKDFIYDNS